MSFGNLTKRPELDPLFGPLSPAENERLLDRLLLIDRRLNDLASNATKHVGVAYESTQLGLFVRAHDAEIAGGPSGDAGDIWFEITYTQDESSARWVAPPWTIEGCIIVFCVDPDPKLWGHACTHDLFRLVDTAQTPEETLSVLEKQVETVGRELGLIDRWRFTKSTHSVLPE